MGLKDLVSDSKNKRREIKKKNDYGELDIYEDLNKLPIIDCNHCEDGTSVPVRGLDEYGSLYKCTMMFCENSLFNHDGEMGEGDVVETHGKMVSAVNRRRLV